MTHSYHQKTSTPRGLLTHHHERMMKKTVGDGDGEDVPGGIPAPPEERGKASPRPSSSSSSFGLLPCLKGCFALWYSWLWWYGYEGLTQMGSDFSRECSGRRSLSLVHLKIVHESSVRDKITKFLRLYKNFHGKLAFEVRLNLSCTTMFPVFLF